MAAIVHRWTVGLVVALMLASTGAIAMGTDSAGAFQPLPCEVIAEGLPNCTPTPTPDPCEVVSKGVDPCVTPEPTATSTPEPTPDPCQIDKSGFDPCATPEPTETPTPEPTQDSCNIPVDDAAALGVVECETPVVAETATVVPTIISGTDDPTPTPAPREPVTSLPSTGLGQGTGSGGQLDSVVPLLAAALMLVIAGAFTRRRLTR